MTKMIRFIATGVLSCFIAALLTGEELVKTRFSGPDMTPSPAVVAAAPTGEVFVGLDLQGSLGKKVGLGKIVRLIDEDNDGKADVSTLYVKVDNPRGLIPMRDSLIVLHTISKGDEYDNQQISLFRDVDNDGVADGSAEPLVTNIGNSVYLKERGADHSANGMRLGIDGWIYIAMGDFGFVGAKGADGRELSMLGGGVVRVRPDGTELETYVTGTRNNYDVAIDPFMNLFTRENTNGDETWGVRALHLTQNAHYGYPSLYTNFPEDMMPAMAEYGAGSGTGCLYLEEPQWSEQYNEQVLMGDWGHSKVYVHELSPLGATFTNHAREFDFVSQVTDFDVDGSGRLYIAAWDGAGYKGHGKKGFIERYTPAGWEFKAFPVLADLDREGLLQLIVSPSMTTRLHASHEVLKRADTAYAPALDTRVRDVTLSRKARVACLYTLTQLLGREALPYLEKYYNESDLREHAVRAMTDRVAVAEYANKDLIIKALQDENPRVRLVSTVALGRIGDSSTALHLLAAAKPVKLKNTITPKVLSVFESEPVVYGDKQEVEMDIDVSSQAQLVLVVDHLGASLYDQAAWINPVIILENGNEVDLTEMKPVSSNVSRGTLGINQDTNGNPLKQKGIGVNAYSQLIYDLPEKASRFRATGIFTEGARGKQSAQGSVLFKVLDRPDREVIPAGYIVPTDYQLHSVSNADHTLSHVSQRILSKLGAAQAVANAIRTEEGEVLEGALMAARSIHDKQVVDALIERVDGASAEIERLCVLTLMRLHQIEKVYDGTTWWGTRPEVVGPYHAPVDWEETATISVFLANYLSENKDQQLVDELKRNQAYVTPYNKRVIEGDKKPVIKVGDTAIEDMILFLGSYPARSRKGKKAFEKVSCVGCHAVDRNSPVRGPDLMKLGHMTVEELAEAILKPDATIAPTWVSIQMNDQSSHIGTVVKEDQENMTINTLAGQPVHLAKSEIAKSEPGPNMMTYHLCDHLSLEEFADMVLFLKSLDRSSKKKK